MMQIGKLKFRLGTLSPKSVVATIVVGGYVLSVGSVFFIEIPGAQRDIAMSAITGLAALAGAIVNSLFKEKTDA